MDQWSPWDPASLAWNSYFHVGLLTHENSKNFALYSNSEFIFSVGLLGVHSMLYGNMWLQLAQLMQQRTYRHSRFIAPGAVRTNWWAILRLLAQNKFAKLLSGAVLLLVFSCCMFFVYAVIIIIIWVHVTLWSLGVLYLRFRGITR